jgi:GDP-mannose transporter
VPIRRPLTTPFFFVDFVRSYNHLIDGNLNILLVVFQAIVAVVCVELCRFLKLVEYATPTWSTVKAWSPVNILFCLMLGTGMASLEHNSVPMVTVFKNVTNAGTTLGDYIFFGSKPEALVIVALGVMLLGAVAAAGKDITISFVGLFWMAANCVSTSSYVLYMRYATTNKRSGTAKLSKFGMVFINNVLCVVFLLPVAFFTGEVRILLSTPSIHTMGYAMKNIFAGFVGFFLNFASLNCVQATGATTYAIVGSLNKIPVAFLGYLLFDSTITPETWFFIAVSMCGGFLFSYAKLQSSRK